MKTNVAVFFGGNSVEHEVSIISALQAIQNIDREVYDVTPVYIAKNGKMYCGQKLFDISNFKNVTALLSDCTPIFMTKEDGKVMLKPERPSLFGYKATVIDVAFPIVHGSNCEDGALSGLFELFSLPYVGCDVLSSAIGMNKAVFKVVLAANGVPVLPCVTFSSRSYSNNPENTIKRLEEKIGYPMIIKPVNLGSSVGISKVDNLQELYDAISLACSFSDDILAERAIENLREINCSVIGYGDEISVSECEEPIMHDKILSYKDKYQGGAKGSKGTKGSKSSGGMSSLSRLLPAPITEEEKATVQKHACAAFKAIGAHGVSRIDFLMDDKTKEIYVNEINTIPGSLAFYLWEATGIKYTELLSKLISLAFVRKRRKDALNYSVDTDILSGFIGKSGGSKGKLG